MDKTCSLCFGVFAAQYGKELYCAPCKIVARKLRQEGYNAVRDPGRKRSGKHKAKPCAFCGAQHQRGFGCWFCKPECRVNYNAAWRENCQRNATKEDRIFVRMWKCGKCSGWSAERCKRQECRNAYQKDWQRQKAGIDPTKEYTCQQCQVTFCPGHKGRKTYCSQACFDKALQARTPAWGHRKRARRLGVPYQPVNALRVFARDGWRCKHCGCPTPASLRGSTAEQAPELDHIVPCNATWLGAHAYHNCQCLCRGCNGAKGGVSNGTWGQLQAAEPLLRGCLPTVLDTYRTLPC